MICPFSAISQDLLLQDCVRECLANNPLTANKELAVKIGEIKKSIVKSAWLPGLDLNAQATWQSDVVVLNLDLPFPVNFPQIPKDQYKITTDISQLVYDGGNIKYQQVIEGINADLTVKEIEVKEFELRQIVEDLYFAILVTDKRIEVLKLMNESLNQTINQVESGVKNGLLADSDLPVVKAERIKMDQQLISLQGLKDRAVSTLGLLMGKQLEPDTRFFVPEVLSEQTATGTRPESQLFEVQRNLIDARISMLNSQLRPKVAAFGQAGYGKPGLNFMGDKWDPYLLIGLKGSWNVWDWGKIKKQKQTLGISQKVIDNQLDAFQRQLTQAESKQQIMISEIEALMNKDIELLGLREIVTQAYGNRLKSGLITASQYLNELTREQEARINLETRKIEWVSAKFKLLIISGKN